MSIATMRQAIQRAYERAAEFQRLGRFREAEAAYQEMITSDPRQAHALFMLGTFAQQKGDLSAATDLIQRAIGVDPSNAGYHGSLGFVYKQLGNLERTIAEFALAARLRSDIPEAHFNLGSALAEAGRWEEAAAAYKEALRLRPRFPEALSSLSIVASKCGNPSEAIQLLRDAISMRPDDVDLKRRLGPMLLEQDLVDEAIVWLQRAVDQGPPDAEIFYNLGVAHMEKGNPAQAIIAYRNALSLRPKYGDAAWNLALSYLQSGDFRHGWRMYESRWSMKERFFHHDLAQPLWDGRPLNGQRIFVHVEQGHGDVIQMVRLIPMVQQRGGRVIFECTRELYSLMADLPGAEKVIALGDSIPEFDVHCPLLSLPGRLDIRLDNIPSQVPYLRANVATVEKWRQHFGDEKRLKVGLVWSGRPYPPHRSIDPGLLSQLAGVRGVQFYSLQKADGPDAQLKLPSNLDLIDLGPQVGDFGNTAAILMNLDLLVTIDTAAAHLAGALGRPVWVLLRDAPDWRWLRGRNDSPWYPGMKLFRQTRARDWSEPLGRVKLELTQLAALHAQQH